VKLTSSVEPAASIAPQTGRKLNAWIIALLSTLVVFMLMERMFFAGTMAESPTIAGGESGASQNTLEATPTQPASAINDKTIAVLPFDDFDAGGEEAYFADGLTEEILNALARTPDLLVASRTSSFQYKDQTVDVREVASTLGVAHILEGSVRRSATRLRVTAQLIRASDGFHLWSENYDWQPDDIIEVQEDIAFRHLHSDAECGNESK
jgi:TolB-like protein